MGSAKRLPILAPYHIDLLDGHDFSVMDASVLHVGGFAVEIVYPALGLLERQLRRQLAPAGGAPVAEGDQVVRVRVAKKLLVAQQRSAAVRENDYDSKRHVFASQFKISRCGECLVSGALSVLPFASSSANVLDQAEATGSHPVAGRRIAPPTGAKVVRLALRSVT